MKINGDMVNKALADIVYNAQVEVANEFAERIKRCLLERDDEMIDYIRDNILEELK